MRTGPWTLAFVVALAIFIGLCWLEFRPAPTLSTAAAAGDTKLAVNLLAQGADVNGADRKGRVPLQTAAEHGHVQMLNLLINAGASVNACDEKGLTALHYAAVLDDQQPAQILINAGADAALRNAEGCTPLCMAVQADSSCVVLLAALEQWEKCKDSKHLFEAARSGCVSMLQILIAHGVDLNRLSETGASPLHYAVLRDHAEAVRLLIEHGVSLDIQDNRGWTPLHHAVRHDRLNALHLLCEAGADTGLRDNHHRTPLLMAAELGRTKAFEELVRNGGADMDIEQGPGRTSEQIAKERGYAGIVGFIQTYRRELRERRKAPPVHI